MLAKWLERAGQLYSNNIAIASGKKGYMTYDELAERVARFSVGVKSKYSNLEQQSNSQPKYGDRIILFASNCPQYLEIMYGCWHGGQVIVPVNNKLHKKEMLDIADDSDACLIFISDDLYVKWGFEQDLDERIIIIGSETYDDIFMAPPGKLVETDENDLAWLFYTSGTTGKSKGAMLSYKNLAAMSYGFYADVDKVKPKDSLIHAAPMSHGSGLYALPFIAMGGVNVIPESGRFEPQEIEELYKFWDSASMFAAPTMVKRLVEAKLDPQGLKNIIYGGGPMYIEDAKRASDAFPGKLTQIYGQGESPMSITVLPSWIIDDQQHPAWAERLGSVGVANQVVDVMIVDQDGKERPDGETGEIIVRGDAVMLGYWKNPEATSQVVRDGWLYTGDMGAMDQEGFITLQDRSKDVIISGGSNIYPREIEEVLLKHDKVDEVSIIARVDPEWGEIPIAYYTGHATKEELDAVCLDNLARFKRPKEYIQLSELPKNNYGKILKTELRNLDQS